MFHDHLLVLKEHFETQINQTHHVYTAICLYAFVITKTIKTNQKLEQLNDRIGRRTNREAERMTANPKMKRVKNNHWSRI